MYLVRARVGVGATDPFFSVRVRVRVSVRVRVRVRVGVRVRVSHHDRQPVDEQQGEDAQVARLS